MPSRDLFPSIEPYAQGMLQVDDIHTLYWEESGNPKGVPVVFLHGGPGAGASPIHRRFFDPTAWRIFIFDQRGAGRSTPLGETRRNTTELLVGDIETLRKFRGIERWHLFGGSWGSTLAIAYAETHPDRCLGLILRGICLLQQREVDWFLYGIRNVFPELWQEFHDFVPPEEQNDLLSAYLKIFLGPDSEQRRDATRLWLRYETSCSTLLPPKELPPGTMEDHRSAMPTMEAHYFKNNVPKPDTKLLDDVGRIRKIPAVIVQGRYDMVCPMITADELHKAWPEAEYRVIPDCGHSALEPGIRSALIEATEKFKAIKS